jgi:hypothetical protein
MIGNPGICDSGSGSGDATGVISTSWVKSITGGVPNLRVEGILEVSVSSLINVLEGHRVGISI